MRDRVMTAPLWTPEIGRPLYMVPGLEVSVRFGSRGSQGAVVSRVGRNGAVFVRKYRASSKRYTQEVRLWPSELLGRWQGMRLDPPPLKLKSD